MKIFETSEEIVDMVNEEFDKTGLSNYGLGLRVLSVTKMKDVLKVNKASATTNFLTGNKVDITLFIYEAAFDRMDDDAQRKMIEMALSNISFDIDKDRINVESNPFTQVFNMRRKYGEEFLNILETSYIVIQQLEEEEKQRKEAEKESKRKKNE